MQDQPILTLTTENYPSLEFIQEIPARSTARRLEFCDETRNNGTARWIYRPMMCATDLIGFLETDFANRGAVMWSVTDAAGVRRHPVRKQSTARWTTLARTPPRASTQVRR
jgi:hypothetical protein